MKMMLVIKNCPPMYCVQAAMLAVRYYSKLRGEGYKNPMALPSYDGQFWTLYKTKTSYVICRGV